MEGFETEYPTVPGSSIDKHNAVSETQSAQAITKDNIQVDLFQHACRTGDGCTFLTFSDGSEFSKGRDWITTINEFGVLSSETEVCIVFEAAVAIELVYLIRGEMTHRIRSIWCVAWTNGSGSSRIVWEESQQRCM
jgi:hypothetical protein